MLDFTADWCPDCKRLEQTTFVDPTVMKQLQGVQLLKADLTADDEQDRALLRKLIIAGPPTIVFFDNNANEIKNLRSVGYRNPADFSKHLEQFRIR
jgi:thiol:disulfide interchange protein DsbD